MTKTIKRVTTLEMEKVCTYGKNIYSDIYFSIRIMDKSTPTTIGIVVSKKVEKTAVERNKIKRRIRETIKNISFPQNKVIVFYIKKEIIKLNFLDLTYIIEKSIKDSTHIIR